jgi:hypothetical protein
MAAAAPPARPSSSSCCRCISRRAAVVVPALLLLAAMAASSGDAQPSPGTTRAPGSGRCRSTGRTPTSGVRSTRRYPATIPPSPSGSTRPAVYMLLFCTASAPSTATSHDGSILEDAVGKKKTCWNAYHRIFSLI